VRAISLWQPWATLVAIGAKRIETRSWSTQYRGPLAIHATKAFPPIAQQYVETEPFWSRLRAARCHQYNLPRGVIVATCRLVDVVRIRATEPRALSDGQPVEISLEELAFGDYKPGRYAWILGDVVRLEEPIPVRGGVGLWEWSPPPERAA
jgi:activating signal cointegrator 1